MKEISQKEAFERFKPESCVFVVSIRKDGVPSGMIAGRNMKCSENPYLFAVALSKKSFTHGLIQESGEFVVAVPNKEIEDALLLFGTTHGDTVNKFFESKLSTMPAKFVKPPLIEKATINFECKLYKEVDSGDHTIFVGEVLTSYVSEGKKILINMGRFDGKRVFEEF